ncbi:N-acetylneuraminate synthase family protein [Fulvivirga sp. 29W222]|uniref:N-acetylneuraminate synthase family protein n=1 Tax=Fulvivirga marina TaxID=2494733 RepID=A0A937FST0_9BACT|nr:N-acetylneuraminate synthase family protein [Fulvivirga marina]MBL6444760.1 N-acetylneuraminate synthase family protein [Fulvivirga marina]
MASIIMENIYNQIESISSKWKTDNIFIIGKGPSVDQFVNLNYEDHLVININDSEKIIKGDIGIFSANWVRQSLRSNGFHCKYYLAGKPLAREINHDLLPPIPFELDDEELITYRFTKPEYYDEPFVLTNALKLCLDIAKITDKKPNVYLLGFDFSTEHGQLSKAFKQDFAHGELDRSLMVHSHETLYLQLAKFCEETRQVDLYHVGEKKYSRLSPQELVTKFSVTKPKIVSDKYPDEQVEHHKVLIVAELTNNHLGDTNRLLEMVERAYNAGADLIKIQKRDVDTFYSKEKLESYYWSPFGKTLKDYRKGVELRNDQIEVLDRKCKELGIDWFCSILDYRSFEIINDFNPGLIKIPSTISNHTDFHKQIAAAYKGPIVISTGYTDKAYEDYVLETFSENEKIYLLHCISSYPTQLNDCNISVVSHYNELGLKYKNLTPGYSSHDIGSFGSVLAVACGARMIEKHVKLGDVDWVHFDKVALDLKDDSFINFVKDVRNAEVALGSSEKKILASEHHKYEVIKK